MFDEQFKSIRRGLHAMLLKAYAEGFNKGYDDALAARAMDKNPAISQEKDLAAAWPRSESFLFFNDFADDPLPPPTKSDQQKRRKSIWRQW